MSALRERAIAFGRQGARNMLAKRKGHGGGPCVRRTLDEAQIAGLLAAAFEAGFKAAQGHG